MGLIKAGALALCLAVAGGKEDAKPQTAAAPAAPTKTAAAAPAWGQWGVPMMGMMGYGMGAPPPPPVPYGAPYFPPYGDAPFLPAEHTPTAEVLAADDTVAPSTP